MVSGWPPCEPQPHFDGAEPVLFPERIPLGRGFPFIAYEGVGLDQSPTGWHEYSPSFPHGEVDTAFMVGYARLLEWLDTQGGRYWSTTTVEGPSTVPSSRPRHC